MTHHLQGDVGRVVQVIGFSHKHRVTLLSHDEHDVCRDGVWSLEVEARYSKMVRQALSGTCFDM